MRARFFDDYFRTRTTSAEQVRSAVWNSSTDIDAYAGAGEKYHAAVLEQYRIYVEMADRVSARRGATNTFFLTLNTLIFTTVGVFWKDRPIASTWYLAFPLLALIAQCGAWLWLVRSYRQLNSAKYIVIGVLEERLPASPYWRAEWTALGEGQDKSRYWPLTHIEQWIPLLFAAAYIAAFATALIA
ncbi:hypothetical protein ABZ783_35940 [Micromonospora sp. NPDC047738]|uniref:RipA family octameric membrane protein n=1 Tax=Micromonospora sp. NPDC047738 TaxID=3155741 RepID=UPI0033E7B1C1